MLTFEATSQCLVLENGEIALTGTSAELRGNPPSAASTSACEDGVFMVHARCDEGEGLGRQARWIRSCQPRAMRSAVLGAGSARSSADR